NTGLFDPTHVDISSSGAARVRFFIGTYWNQQSSVAVDPSDIMQFASVFSSGNSTDVTMPTNRIRGRLSAGEGAEENLTAAQVTSFLNLFTSTLKGLVPAPGTPTGKFLQDTGGWASVAAGGDVTGPI